MQWIPSEKKEQSDALFDGQVTEVYLIDGHALPPSAIHEALARPEQEQESKLKPFVFFKTDNGWRKEEFEKTLVKKVPLDTTPPEPHVWFDFSNCDKYRSKEEFEKTLVPLDATPPKREWVGLDDEDMKELRDANFDLLYGARWAERKLREKNGG